MATLKRWPSHTKIGLPPAEGMEGINGLGIEYKQHDVERNMEGIYSPKGKNIYVAFTFKCGCSQSQPKKNGGNCEGRLLYMRFRRDKSTYDNQLRMDKSSVFWHHGHSTSPGNDRTTPSIDRLTEGAATTRAR